MNNAHINIMIVHCDGFERRLHVVLYLYNNMHAVYIPYEFNNN